MTLHQDVVVLTSDNNKPPIPIAIHSLMVHVMLQTGLSSKEKGCPALKCVSDSGAALSTANFHFMETVICQFPHILKKIYLPDNYAAIILSIIVNTPDSMPITAELNVGFDIHLPYTTKDGSNTSLLDATGPNVAINHILGLPFIKTMGMIADFVNNVCETKNLLCYPFPINFICATKSILVFQESKAASKLHDKELQHTIHILGMLKSFYECKDADSKWLHVIKPSPEGESNPCKHQALSSGGQPSDRVVRFGNHWIPPATLADDINNYHNQVLGDLGYLYVSITIRFWET